MKKLKNPKEYLQEFFIIANLTTSEQDRYLKIFNKIQLDAVKITVENCAEEAGLIRDPDQDFRLTGDEYYEYIIDKQSILNVADKLKNELMQRIKTAGNDLIIILISTNEDLMFDNIDGRILSHIKQTYKNIRNLGRLSELSEEECSRFVEINDNLIVCGTYYKDYYHYSDWYSTAKESLISLLQSNGIDISKEQLLIEIL